MNQKTFVIAMLFSIFMLSNLHSQESFPPSKHLSVDSTYFDGYRQHINVRARQIKLISFLAQHAKKTAADSSFFNIGFLVPAELASKNIDIFVEDRKQKSYYMLPVQKKWSAGLQSFTWRSNKAANQKIGLDDLFALAKLKDPDFGENVIPITLFYSQRPTQIENYEFVFIAPRTANLRYRIFDEAEKEIRQGLFRNQPANTNIVIKWDCENAQPGKYLLWIEYNLRNGEVSQSESTYEFHHNE